MQRLDVRVPPGPRAAGEARRKIAPLEGDLDRATFADVELLVSELVTNSYRHALHRSGEQIEIHVRLDPGCVRVEVWDRGPGFRPPRFGSPHTERVRASGWGLYLVERMADRWGVGRGRGSGAGETVGRDGRGEFTRVWFEKDLTPAPAAQSG